MGRNGKKAGNQHNAKHDGGIVAPGKRISKQKSNGHLGNGPTDNSSTITKAKDNSAALNPVVPQSSFSAAQENSGTATSNLEIRSSSSPRTISHHNQSDSASDELEESDTMPARVIEQQPRRVVDLTTAKQSAIPDTGMIHLALTVLRSCPIADTMAILVILLSLPPAFLHLTNAIFAMLTFVPPSGSFTTLPSLSDITSSFSPGAPSFVVLVAIDLIAICLWSIMPWPHMQTVLLDCAQATVATTLGGGYTFRSGSSDNLLLVITFVFATHMGRYRKTTLKWLHRTPLTKYLPLIESLHDLPAKPSYVLSSNRSWFDTLKIYVALHILLQGLTRMVRRALNAPRDSSFTTRNTDPEANNNSTSTDTNELNPPSSPSPMKSKTSLQNLRDTRDKISSGKRRKKQANYVRSQQPLWAAIAATKAKIMREYEQSQATRDAMGAQSSGIQDLGSAPFAREEDKIWITAIQPDKIYFETGPIYSPKVSGSQEVADEAGTGLFPAFTVRVNGAAWASIKVLALHKDEDSHGKVRWIGEIYGLSAANTYKISFVWQEDEVELHSEIIVTPSSPVAEQAISSSIIPTQALRPASPASPIATVKTSIAAFEASINDLLLSQKRIRKDGKALRAKLDKELENLQEKLTRVLSATRNMNQKQNQLENSIKLIDEAVSILSEQINEQGPVPEETTKEWQEHKTAWEKIRNELSRVQEDVQRTKEDNRTSLTAVQTKELSERQKRDRAQTRVKKLTTDYANLQAPAKNPDHRRANSAYAQRAAELDQKEAQALYKYESLRLANQEVFRETQIIKAEIDHLEHIACQNDAFIAAQTQARFAHDSRPITPEGDLPGTNSQAPGSNQSASFSRPYQFNAQEPGHAYPTVASNIFSNGFGLGNRQTTVSNNRHRSQSAVSGGVAYAAQEDEDDDDDPIPLMHKRRIGIGAVREGSDGRSSSSGSPHVSVGAVAPPSAGAERKHSPAY